MRDNSADGPGSAYVPNTVRYILDACRDSPWRAEVFDDHSSYLVKVSSGGADFFSGDGSVCAYPINSATAYTISVDKAHTYTILRRAGLSVPVGEHFFISQMYSAVRAPGKEFADAISYADDTGYPLFAKPNNGSRGAFATVVLNRNDLIYHLMAMSGKYQIALLQQVVPGDEYRFFVLDGVVLYAHQRLQPLLIGDGERTIRESMRIVNEQLKANGLTAVNIDSEYFKKCLFQDGLDLNSVVPKGGIFKYSARSNISIGGGIANFTEAVSPAVAEYCKQIARALNLRVCGIDILTESGIDDPANFVVLEVNGNPAISALEKIGRYDKIISIWKTICELYFDQRPFATK